MCVSVRLSPTHPQSVTVIWQLISRGVRGKGEREREAEGNDSYVLFAVFLLRFSVVAPTPALTTNDEIDLPSRNA